MADSILDPAQKETDMDCMMLTAWLHCFVGRTSISIYRYDHPIESAWHQLGYNPAGGEGTVDRLVVGNWVLQRVTPTGRGMHRGEDGKWVVRDDG